MRAFYVRFLRWRIERQVARKDEQDRRAVLRFVSERLGL